MSQTGIIERAFQLAPDCTSFEEIRRKLKREGYDSVDSHLASGALKKDLVKLLQRGTRTAGEIMGTPTGSIG